MLMGETVLQLKSISKNYGQTVALKDVDLSFEPGIYGLLGANGAGKSTLLNLISTLLKPSTGEILYNGQDILAMGEEYRNILGYMPQQQSIYPNMSVLRFLHYMSALKGIDKRTRSNQIDTILKEVNLDSVKYRKIKTLSGGMKQRLLIAQSIINNPKVLILDEPTAGLDPVERMRLRNFIKRISSNKIIIIATHVVTDIEYIADKVILLKEGKILENATQEELINRTFVVERQVNHQEFEELINKYKVTRLLNQENDVVVRYIIEDTSEESKLKEFQVRASLDDVYLKWLG